MDATEQIREMIAARELRISELQKELVGLRFTLSLIALETITRNGTEEEAATSTVQWRTLAGTVFGDRGPHSYSEICTAIDDAFGAGAVNHKTVHLWLSKQVEMGRLLKVERGVYKLADGKSVVAAAA